MTSTAHALGALARFAWRIRRNALRMGEIQDSLDRLDATFREPFLMHHEGYKYHEIAEHLGIPIGTVKSRIFQARQRLMRMLSDKVPA